MIPAPSSAAVIDRDRIVLFDAKGQPLVRLAGYRPAGRKA